MLPIKNQDDELIIEYVCTLLSSLMVQQKRMFFGICCMRGYLQTFRKSQIVSAFDFEPIDLGL